MFHGLQTSSYLYQPSYCVIRRMIWLTTLVWVFWWKHVMQFSYLLPHSNLITGRIQLWMYSRLDHTLQCALEIFSNSNNSFYVRFVRFFKIQYCFKTYCLWVVILEPGVCRWRVTINLTYQCSILTPFSTKIMWFNYPFGRICKLL